MHRTVRGSGGLLSAVLLAAGSLSSCSSGGGGDGGAKQDAKATSSQSASASASNDASASPDESASSATPSASDQGEPAATREGSADGQKVTLEVSPVQRSGDTVVLNFALTVGSSATDNVGLYDLFGDNDPNTGNADSSASVDGVKLVDTTHRKLYLVASDGDGSCVCTNGFSGASAEPGEVVNMSATYAAPPEDVTTLSVTIPTFGTFTDVPIS